MTIATAKQVPKGLHMRRDEAAEAWRPAVDISERADAYVVTVDVPGVNAGEVEITMEDGQLTIRGRRYTARAASGKVHRSERGGGLFQRELALPSSHVKAAETEASVRDGVLEIVVPKASTAAQAGLIRVGVDNRRN